MTIMLKIMQSGFDYDRKSAQQQRDLYYAKFSNIPSIKVGGMTFYEINDLLSIQELSTTKQNKLSKLKPGDSMQLFNVGRDRYYHAVRLNTKEEATLQDLQKEQDELTKINQQIEAQVGHLLKTKKTQEENIDNLKKVFKN
jgi:uncharacterized protein YqfB (UPF0267 family)